MAGRVMRPIARLSLPRTPAGDPASIGATFRLDGEPFPWPTSGPVSLEMGHDRLTVLVVRIPIAMDGAYDASPAELNIPASPPEIVPRGNASSGG